MHATKHKIVEQNSLTNVFFKLYTHINPMLFLSLAGKITLFFCYFKEIKRFFAKYRIFIDVQQIKGCFEVKDVGEEKLSVIVLNCL
jgi:hypothetical protein